MRAAADIKIKPLTEVDLDKYYEALMAHEDELDDPEELDTDEDEEDVEDEFDGQDARTDIYDDEED